MPRNLLSAALCASLLLHIVIAVLAWRSPFWFDRPRLDALPDAVIEATLLTEQAQSPAPAPPQPAPPPEPQPFVEPAPAEPAIPEPAPTEPDPIEPEPVEPAPVEPDPVAPTPVDPAPAAPEQPPVEEVPPEPPQAEPAPPAPPEEAARTPVKPAKEKSAPKPAEKTPDKTPEKKPVKQPPPDSPPQDKPKTADLSSVLKAVEGLRPPPQEKNALDQVLSSLDRRDHDTTAQAAPGEQLSESELGAIKRQIGRCWKIPDGVPNAEKLVVRLRVSMNPDMSVRAVDILGGSRLPQWAQAAEEARRAVLKCSPLRLPPGKYAAWRIIQFNFDPKEMLE